MTISSTSRKAGPYLGNGATTEFPFGFKVFSASDVVVIHTDTGGVETTLVLTTDYTVDLEADQDASPGGTVTLPAPLATGYKLTITSSIPQLQTIVLTNQGGFYPEVINTALDKLTIFTQEIAEQVSRTVKTDISSDVEPSELLDTIIAAAASAAANAVAADNSADAAAASAASISLPLPVTSGGTGETTLLETAQALDDARGVEHGEVTLSSGSLEFSVPPWARRITFTLNAVLGNVLRIIYVHLGDSGGFEVGSMAIADISSAPEAISGVFVLARLTGNTWVLGGAGKTPGTSASDDVTGGGVHTLSDALTSVRVTSSGGLASGTLNAFFD